MTPWHFSRIERFFRAVGVMLFLCVALFLVLYYATALTTPRTPLAGTERQRPAQLSPE
jgi:hypothetical protein